MKITKRIAALLLLAVLLIGLSACYYTQDELYEAYQEGYGDGYENGYDDGWDDGYDDGWDDGWYDASFVA